jgi:hypothetical protein
MKDFDFYTPIYKYRNLENALAILKNESIYLSCPAEFNDPFEFNSCLLDKNITTSFIHERIENDFHDRPASWREAAKTQTPPEKFISYIEREIDRVRSSAGVFCASKKYDITLMWSHYADAHKGFCLGFKFPNTIDFFLDFVEKEQLVAAEVHYKDVFERYPCVVGNDLFSREALYHWFCTKSAAWKHEEEIRLIKMDNVKKTIKISPDWITEIYFGINTPKRDSDQITEILNESRFSSIKRYKMTVNENSFNLIRKEYDGY